MIQKFRGKSEIIEAVEFTRNNWDEVQSFTGGLAHTIKIPKGIDEVASCVIETPEGNRKAVENDWIIKSSWGGIFVCDSEIFNKIYEQL